MMKKTLIIGFIFLFPLMVFAQQQQQKKQKISGYLKFGDGLYRDISKLEPIYYAEVANSTVNGQQIWIEGGIRLHGGLIATAGIMHVNLERHYVPIDKYYEGQKYQYSIRNYTCGLGYEFKLGKHSRLMPQLDFTVNRTKSYTAYFYKEYNSNIPKPKIYNFDDTEAGVVLNLDYYYRFKVGLCVGVRSGAYYVNGMEGITLTPVLGFEF